MSLMGSNELDPVADGRKKERESGRNLPRSLSMGPFLGDGLANCLPSGRACSISPYPYQLVQLIEL